MNSKTESTFVVSSFFVGICMASGSGDVTLAEEDDGSDMETLV